MNVKYILIGVCVVLAVVVAVLFYRMGITNERTDVLKAEISLHKANALEFVKLAKNKDKQNQRLLKEINTLQCDIEVVEQRLKQRNKQLDKIRADVQDNINAYAIDSNRIKLFTELLKWQYGYY